MHLLYFNILELMYYFDGVDFPKLNSSIYSVFISYGKPSLSGFMP